jgi:tetratricopeptide (TPR) repeat protein
MLPLRLNSRLWLAGLTVLVLAGCGRLSQDHERRGDRYYSIGYYDDSLAEYLMAQKTRGVSADLMRKIGKVYVKKGDFFQAKKYFDRYFSTVNSEPSPEVLLDYLQIAVERGKAGDNGTMVRALEEILAVDPSYSLGKYYFDLGEYYYQQSDFHKAVSYFLRAVPLEVQVDHRDEYLFHLALSYEKLLDYANAFLYFDQYLAQYPQGSQVEQARWHRGSCCFPLARDFFDRGELDQAASYLDRIISSGQPQNLLDDAWYLRGEIFLAQERPEEARNAFQEVLKLNRYYWKERIADQARRQINELDLQKRVPAVR